jgi:hypothetical protein
MVVNPVPGELLFHQQNQKVNYCRFHAPILLSDSMKDVIYLLCHPLSTLAKLARLSGGCNWSFFPRGGPHTFSGAIILSAHEL